jgi:hypothetical protein
MLLLLTACQRKQHEVCILTCRKQNSHVDILGVTNKFIMFYIDDSTNINLQHIEKPYAYSIRLRCEDTLARVSERLYRAFQRKMNFYTCGYKDIMEDCLRKPKDTTYTWSSRIYTAIVFPDSIQGEVSSIDVIVSDDIYKRVLGRGPLLLVAANETTYCDCPVFGYLLLKPDPKHRIREITVKHYRMDINDICNE